MTRSASSNLSDMAWHTSVAEPATSKPHANSAGATFARVDAMRRDHRPTGGATMAVRAAAGNSGALAAPKPRRYAPGQVEHRRAGENGAAYRERNRHRPIRAETLATRHAGGDL